MGSLRRSSLSKSYESLLEHDSPHSRGTISPEPGDVAIESNQQQRWMRDKTDGWLDERPNQELEIPTAFKHSLRLVIVLFLGCVAAIILLSQILTTSHPSPGKTGAPHTPRGYNAQAGVHPVASVSPAVSTPSAPALLEVFQVYQPVLMPSGPVDQTISSDGTSNTTSIIQTAQESNCTLLLMEYSFGFSYGHPFVGKYIPPSCKFNRVVMNFTVTSRGRQFDRLALMYLGDTEVWRTSTAEPSADGIIWTYIKDMSEYQSLWNQPQKLIFDLGNLIDSTYTGFFNTTLTATFFMGSDTLDPAAMIIPISARGSATNSSSVFLLPSTPAINNITNFPQNANRAVFSVSACGQASEEFWWSNVLQSDIDTFNASDGVLAGFSPWREVQIYIDGHLAGVQLPFPVIFTGGLAPGLWRPIVGIDAFDLREHQIDITPWLPLLCDGNPHTFEIKVAGITDDGGPTGVVVEAVGDSWYVTGKIFVWLDSELSITTGTPPIVVAPPPTIALKQLRTRNATGSANETLTYSILVSRSLSVSTSVIRTQMGESSAVWSQALSYSNYGAFTNEGNTQVNSFCSSGIDTSTGCHPYRSSYSYPLFANTSFVVDPSGNFSISVSASQGLNLEVTGESIYPSGLEAFSNQSGGDSPLSSLSGSYLHTLLNGSAYYFSSPSTNTGISFGSTAQEFSFGGANAGATVELYHRDVEAVNGSVVRDSESVLGASIGQYHGPSPPSRGVGLQSTVDSPRAAIGRGPGKRTPVLVQTGSQVSV